MKSFKLITVILAIALLNACRPAPFIAERIEVKFDGPAGEEIEIMHSEGVEKIKIPGRFTDGAYDFTKKEYKKPRTKEVLTFTNTTKDTITTVLWEAGHANFLIRGYWTEKNTATPFTLLNYYHMEDLNPDNNVSKREGYIPREELYKILEEKKYPGIKKTAPGETATLYFSNK